ncbi:SDR family NAD(P)-dependent oxidoreductase [Limibacillus halophilus]|uniref:NAD(P)-dependent dehydrogenase (Short-subunit alcohol dehydrogenase family) n=1 Tax=Limibacillus halophilus TaxID=1579333 RepID=A0A839SQU0_9PROT|nr:SDR family NAD(P)-dependent oxidoreductase [Limibacillus halophilus]MBB3064628.1 NAD(P)-dependent dehydrogenase (short-subunit alcohol dehydrogenase family) [Limibacillus halophilus]
MTEAETSNGSCNGRLRGRIALITGASRGIGAAVAKAFAREGAQLVLVSRTVGGLEEIDDEVQALGAPPATLVPLDLQSFEAIDQLGASLFERFGKLDVLIANAGILGALSPTGHIDPKVWQRVIDINLTANYRLIRSLEPLLRQSEAGRAVFVTSGAAQGVRPYWGPYAVSKAGLEALVRNWAGEVTKTNLKINMVDPGGTRTAMRALAYPTEDPALLKTPEDIAEHFVPLAMADCSRHGEIISLK